MQVKWLKQTQINLEHSANYLNEHNPQAAGDFVKEVYDLIALKYCEYSPPTCLSLTFGKYQKNHNKKSPMAT